MAKVLPNPVRHDQVEAFSSDDSPAQLAVKDDAVSSKTEPGKSSLEVERHEQTGPHVKSATMQQEPAAASASRSIYSLRPLARLARLTAASGATPKSAPSLRSIVGKHMRMDLELNGKSSQTIRGFGAGKLSALGLFSALGRRSKQMRDGQLKRNMTVPLRFAMQRYNSSGTMLTNSRRRSSGSRTAPPRVEESKVDRCLGAMRQTLRLEARTKYQLPVHPKSEQAFNRIEEATKDVPLFNSADDLQNTPFAIGKHQLGLKRALFLAMKTEIFNAGDVVITQGERGDRFYVVESGEYKVFLSHAPDTSVHTYKDEGSFGDLALLYSVPRAASIKCTHRGKLWSLDRETFRRTFVAHGQPDPTARFRRAVSGVHNALQDGLRKGVAATGWVLPPPHALPPSCAASTPYTRTRWACVCRRTCAACCAASTWASDLCRSGLVRL